MICESCKLEPTLVERIIGDTFSDIIPRLFACGQQFIFPIRGASGGLTTTYIIYLRHKIGQKDFHRNRYSRLAVEFNNEMTGAEITGKISRALSISTKDYLEYNADGGDLGREIDNPVQI